MMKPGEIERRRAAQRIRWGCAIALGDSIKNSRLSGVYDVRQLFAFNPAASCGRWELLSELFLAYCSPTSEGGRPGQGRRLALARSGVDFTPAGLEKRPPSRSHAT